MQNAMRAKTNVALIMCIGIRIVVRMKPKEYPFLMELQHKHMTLLETRLVAPMDLLLTGF